MGMVRGDRIYPIARAMTLCLDLLLLIVSSLIALALAETTFRFVGDRLLSRGEWFSVGQIYKRFDPIVGFSLEPNSSQLIASGGAYLCRVSINSEGLRDVEHPQHKRPGVKRVLVLGDSFMFGQGVRMEQSMPRQLEALLPGAEVINTGVPGYNLGQEYLYYKDRGARFEADLVLLAFFINDLARSREVSVTYDAEGLPISFQASPEIARRDLEASRRGLRGAIPSWLRSHSLLYVVARKRLENLASRGRAAKSFEDPQSEIPYLGAFTLDSESPSANEWGRAYRILDALGKRVASDRSRFAVILIPAPFQTSERAWNTWVGSWRTPAASLSRRRPQEMMMAWCARSQTPCFDLLDDFKDLEDDRYYFPYDSHWTAEGHRLAAQSVSRFLRSQGLP